MKIQNDIRYYSKTDIQCEAGVTEYLFDKGVERGIVEAPTHKLGSFWYYTEDEAAKAVANLKQGDAVRENNHFKAQGYWTKGDIIRAANKSRTVLAHHLRTGAIKEPTHEVGGPFLMYSEDEAKEIVAFLTDARAAKNEQRKKNGWHTLGEVVRLCGVSPASVQYHREAGALPHPAVQDGLRRYYSAEQAKEIQHFFKNRKEDK